MKLNRIYEIDRCVLEGSKRLGGVRIDAERGELVASDGNVAAFVPVVLDATDNTKSPIDPRALAMAREHSADEVSLALRADRAVMLNGLSLEKPAVDSDAPDAEKIRRCALIGISDARARISFDVGLLDRVAKALGTSKVSLFIAGELEPIRVEPAEAPESGPAPVGVVMPIRPDTAFAAKLPSTGTDVEKLAIAAVTYILDRVQYDPDVFYVLGVGTESFHRLCVAEAAATNRTIRAVEAARAVDLQPAHRKRGPIVEELRKRIDEFEQNVTRAARSE